jgi:hypothetical protein
VKAYLESGLGRLIAISWCCVASIATADIVIVIPSEDATISEKSVEFPLGNDTTLDAGTTGPNEGFKRNRSLLKFDLRMSVPTNAVVTSAALTVTLVTTPTSSNLWFSLHKVLQDWSESVVTWTNRLTPAAPWNSPGGAAELDYVSSISQSNLIIGTTPSNFTFASSQAMVADVQDWVTNPSNNFGWILFCELEDLERSVRKFGSSERGTTNQRPSLEVQFTVPTPPLTLTLLPPANGQFQFQFNAESNKNYTVLYATELEATNWVVLTNIGVMPTSADVLISDPLLIESNRFYRVSTP